MNNLSGFVQASHIIATALDVVQTSHSYGDVMLLTKASEHSKVSISLFLLLFTITSFPEADYFILINGNHKLNLSIHAAKT